MFDWIFIKNFSGSFFLAGGLSTYNATDAVSVYIIRKTLFLSSSTAQLVKPCFFIFRSH